MVVKFYNQRKTLLNIYDIDRQCNCVNLGGTSN